MSDRSAVIGWSVGALVVAALIIVPLATETSSSDSGFDGRIQSGTCDQPTEDFSTALDSVTDHDVEPYRAVGPDSETVTLGFYGAPKAPGFSVTSIHADQRFSMVLTDSERGRTVACGDLLEPVSDRFAEVGQAVVQLLPVGSSDVQGVAILDRAPLQRELDIPPTEVRIIVTTEAVATPAETAPGFDGQIQGGRCDAPDDGYSIDLRGRDDEDADVTALLAHSPGTAEPVTVAYTGAQGAPGFGTATAYADQDFSLAVTSAGTSEAVACGDILEPADDAFTEAGLALVRLASTDADTVAGYALLERTATQRELDITPTRVQIVVFAGASSGA